MLPTVGLTIHTPKCCGIQLKATLGEKHEVLVAIVAADWCIQGQNQQGHPSRDATRQQPGQRDYKDPPPDLCP